MNTVWLKVYCVAMLMATWVPETVWAEPDLSPAERQAAAEAAYDRGTRAYRAGRYAQAAGWYETAHELAPAAHALIQAIRAHLRAGHTLRAGTLALALGSTYGARRAARYRGAVAKAAKSAMRVKVQCSQDCTVALDGEAEAFRELFVTPDTQHIFTVTLREGDSVDLPVMGPPGDFRTLDVAPPEPEPEPEADAEPEPKSEPELAPPSRGPEVPAEVPVSPSAPPHDRGVRVLSPAVFLVGLAMAVGTGGAAGWSWIDTKDAEKRYVAMPTLERYEDGRRREKRTSGLLGASLALGTLSLTLGAFFTDFSGDTREGNGARVGVSPLPHGALVMLGRSMP